MQKLKSSKEEWGKLKTLMTWWARGPEEESSSRTRSPVAMWGTPRRVESLEAYVPLPTPGQPRNTHWTFLSLTSRCKGRGFWPSRHAALGSISEFSRDEERKLLTAKQPPALNLRTRFRTAMGDWEQSRKHRSIFWAGREQNWGSRIMFLFGECWIRLTAFPFLAFPPSQEAWNSFLSFWRLQTRHDTCKNI